MGDDEPECESRWAPRWVHGLSLADPTAAAPQSLGVCVYWSSLQPRCPPVLAPALASLQHLHPRGSLLPSQNQPVLPGAKQWRSIPKPAMNSLGAWGACSVGGAELGGGRGGGDRTFAVKRKVAAQQASVITAPGWLYLLAFLIKKTQALIVGGILIPCTDEYNFMLVINDKKGCGGACSKPVPHE